MLYEKSAGIIIFIQDNSKKLFLLLQHPGGRLDFPKGKVEKDETEEAAAKREVKEETGITNLKFIPKFEEKIHYFFRRGKQLISKDVIYLLAETATKEVKISFEHEGFAWLTYDEAIRKLNFKNQKELLEKAKKTLSKD